MTTLEEPLQTDGQFWLVGIKGNTRRVRLPEGRPLLVGRGAHNHLVLNDYRISRQHSRVTREQGSFVVYDLNSSNGTFVNGVAVSRQEIQPNDEISFGPHAFRLEHVEGPPSVAGPRSGGFDEAVEMITSSSKARKRAADRSAAGRPRPAPSDTGSFALTEEVEALRAQRAPTIRPLEEAVSIVDDGSLGAELDRFRAEAANVDLFQLEDAYRKLTTLYAFMQAISTTIDRGELLSLISRRILDVYPTARGVAIYLYDPDASEFVLCHSETSALSPARRAAADGTLRDALHVLPHETVQAVLAAGRAISGVDPIEQARASAFMHAPLVDREDTFGVIQVTTGTGLPRFSRADLELLYGMAVPAAITLQNARMHAESLLRERMNRDLELAAQMQKSFLPRELPRLPGMEFLAAYRAAYTIGGDFYDVFWVSPDRVAAFVGDIAGKGIAAALLMARITGELRVAARAHVEPAPVLAAMNQAVIDRGQDEVFFTAVYFTLDVKTGEVCLVSAGHPPPYLCHADGVVEAITQGASPAVGMLEDVRFTATRFFLRPGDSLVLYTDGVVEAAAPDGSLYGEERLATCLAGTGSAPRAIEEGILHDVGRHTSTAPANDDLTIFVCHRTTDETVRRGNRGPRPR